MSNISRIAGKKENEKMFNSEMSGSSKSSKANGVSFRPKEQEIKM